MEDTINDNPYEPPVISTETTNRWCNYLAITSFLLGSLSVAFGIFVLLLVGYAIWLYGTEAKPSGMITLSFVFLVFGITWIYAGVCYRSDQLRRGFLASGIGVFFLSVMLRIVALIWN